MSTAVEPEVAGCKMAPGHRPGAWAVLDDHREELRRLQPPNVQRITRDAASLVGVGGGIGIAGSWFGYGLPAFAFSLLAGGAGLYARHRDDDLMEQNQEAIALRDEFGSGPVWTVDLLIRQGEAPTGRDQGLMWIEGGRVLFSGKRTSFAISPGQTKGIVRHELAVRELRLRLNLPLNAETAVGPVSLSFWPIADGYRRAEEDASAMRYAFNSILEGGRWSPPIAITGQWPPFEIGPGALSPELARRCLLQRAGLWVGGAFLFSLPLAVAFPWIGLAEFSVLLVIAYVINRNELKQRRQACADARRAWSQA